MSAQPDGCYHVRLDSRSYSVWFHAGEATQVDQHITPRGRLGSRPYNRTIWWAGTDRGQSWAAFQAISEARKIATATVDANEGTQS